MAEAGQSSSTGRSVRLFLADGTPHGLIVADIGNWNGKVLCGPRSRIAELLRRPEASRTGVYVQIGPDPDRPGELLAYIGETDDIAARMRYHLRSDSKDFFDRVAFQPGRYPDQGTCPLSREPSHPLDQGCRDSCPDQRHLS